MPVGIALPAGIMSAVTFNISGEIETAFSSVDGNYVSLTAGWVRAASEAIACSAQRQWLQQRLLMQFHLGMGPLLLVGWARQRSRCCRRNDRTDIVGAIYATPIQATTAYYNAGNSLGAVVSCQQAGQNIQQSIAAFATDTSNGGFNALYNAAVTQQLPQPNGPGWNARLSHALQLVLANTTFSQEAVINTIVWGNLIAASLHAASISDRDLAYEAFMTDAMEKYKASAAGEANLFVKLMLPSMNILLFMFFAFSPVIAIVMLATGLHGLGVAAKYLLFGIWTQTWMPTAAIINYFIQMQFANTMSSLNVGSDPADVISVANQASFYNLLSTQLAVASTYLAATPVLTLALISGSFFALTRVAERASGHGHFEERRARRISRLPLMSPECVAISSRCSDKRPIWGDLLLR